VLPQEVSVQQQPELTEVSGLQQFVLHLDVPVLKSQSCTFTCFSTRYVVLRLDVSIYTSFAAPLRVHLCCTWRCLSTEPVLHL
jgi:hypothetical protein